MLMPKGWRSVFTLAAWLVSGGTASAQCDAWLASPCTHAPFHGRFCDAAVSYTPPGATAPRLFVGGTDVRFQGADLGNIGQWNGTQWSAVGGGTNNDVRDMIVWNSPSGPVLVAAGVFTTAGSVSADGIAIWNGTSWSALQLGLRTAGGNNGWGYALATWDPDGTGPLGQHLIVGGNFQQAGNVAAASNIARWDGSTWHALLSGTSGTVNALTTWDPDGAGPLAADLIVGGNFGTAGGAVVNGLARYNGSWQPVGGGLSYAGSTFFSADALTTWDPDGPGPLNSRLVVGGYFTHAGATPAAGVAAWNGSTWQAFGTGPFTIASALTTWDPDGPGPQFAQLVFGGSMYDAVGAPVPTPRIWDGSAWQRLGQYVSAQWVDDFATWDPDGAGSLPARLVACGNIQETTPTGFAKGAMQLFGTEWRHFGTIPLIYSSASFNGRAVMGGDFQMIAESATAADHVFIEAWNLAAWNGLTIGSLGTVTGQVRALKSYNISGPAGAANLLVGGTFGAAGGILVNNIARYAEGQTALNSGWFTVGQGFNGTVYAIERLGTTIFVGGSFTASGATATSNVAFLSSGNFVQAGFGANGTVHTLKVYNGSLYAGGAFTSAGGSATGSLARWTGTNWTTLSGAFPGAVYALEVHGGELIIGGSFPAVAGSTHIARWNGTTFSALGGAGTNQPVRAFTVALDGHLYAGGDFTSISGVSASRVARWNGAAWSEVRGGVAEAPVHTLVSYRNEVHAGGTFGTASNSTLAAPAWARYSVNGVPWIALQPLSVHAMCAGSTVQVWAYPAMGYYPLTATWRRNGVPVTFGPTPWGSTVLNGFNGIEVQNAQVQDEGVYDVVFTHACGSVTSSGATLSVCYGNCDCSTAAPTLNVADFTCYLTRYAAGEPYANCDASTAAPALNVADFTCFLQRYAAGCP